jgi:hypothetical protein
MITNKTGYILMLDVLGYREFVTKTKSDFPILWRELQENVKKQRDVIFKELNGSVIVDVLFVSDTIFIGVSTIYKNKQLEGLTIMFLIDLVKLIFKFSLKNNVFFRGAISFGEYLFDLRLNLVMGNAVDEASEWYESTDWFGVILTPTAEYKYNSTILNEDEQQIFKFCMRNIVRYPRIPYKAKLPSEKCSFLVVKWFDAYVKEEDRLGFLTQIMDAFSTVKQSPEVASKYENTFHFIMYYTYPEGFSPYKRLNNS